MGSRHFLEAVYHACLRKSLVERQREAQSRVVAAEAAVGAALPVVAVVRAVAMLQTEPEDRLAAISDLQPSWLSAIAAANHPDLLARVDPSGT